MFSERLASHGDIFFERLFAETPVILNGCVFAPPLCRPCGTRVRYVHVLNYVCLRVCLPPNQRRLIPMYRPPLCLLYHQALFLWVVSVINNSLGKGEDSLPFIGVLDIFGASPPSHARLVPYVVLC